MAQTDRGPATNTGVFTFAPNSTSVEVHVPVGSNSLHPGAAPNVHFQAAYTGTVVNKVVSGVQMTLPA